LSREHKGLLDGSSNQRRWLHNYIVEFINTKKNKHKLKHLKTQKEKILLTLVTLDTKETNTIYDHSCSVLIYIVREDLLDKT
jgi:hypothetical protein